MSQLYAWAPFLFTYLALLNPLLLCSLKGTCWQDLFWRVPPDLSLESSFKSWSGWLFLFFLKLLCLEVEYIPYVSNCWKCSLVPLLTLFRLNVFFVCRNPVTGSSCADCDLQKCMLRGSAIRNISGCCWVEGVVCTVGFICVVINVE